MPVDTVRPLLTSRTAATATRLDATLSLGTPTDGDSTKQLPPGLDAIDLPRSGKVTLNNTTRGRDAPGLGQVKIQMFGS